MDRQTKIEIMVWTIGSVVPAAIATLFVLVR
jgi:hypothetical protein